MSIHSIRSHCHFLNFISHDFNKPLVFPKDYTPDGILVSYDDDLFQADWLDAMDVPVVNIFNSVKKHHPSVGLDYQSIAALAVEHFSNLNYTNIGVLGTNETLFTQDIYQAFTEECAKRDLPCWMISVPDGISPGDTDYFKKSAPDLKDKLLNSKGSTGVYTFHDIRGRLLVDYCADLGVKIPEEVGVLGRFNTLNARLCTPELSSIVVPTTKMGVQAMQLLINLIEGREIEDLHPRPKAQEIRVRQSTVGEKNPDMIVLQARSIIRENACSGLTVDELVQSLPLARSTFEKRYRAMTGASPAQHIREIRVETARQLLLTTQRTIDEIAFSVGFTDARPFVVFFSRETGETPGEFRKKFANT